MASFTKINDICAKRKIWYLFKFRSCLGCYSTFYIVFVTDLKLKWTYPENNLLHVNNNHQFFIHIQNKSVNNDLIATKKESKIIQGAIENINQKYNNADPEVLWTIKRKPETTCNQVNKIAKKVGKEMSREIINFELLDEYYLELQNVHKSKKFGRFAQTLFLSGPRIFQEELETANI